MIIKICISGIVQGIGFRPNTLKIANELGIFGEVKNTGGNVEIIAKGTKQALDEFVQRLDLHCNANDKIITEIEDKQYSDFKITHSTKDFELPMITPDLSTCKECESELKNENNRRHNHPFISCVNCGPRYSIIEELPYDRENTSMVNFPMCKNCENEYTDSKNRRCHAQTIACNDCGPKLNKSIDWAVKTLKQEKVLAIKDIGGYHFSAYTKSAKAINKIRQIKRRDFEKPFAVMFKNIEEIKEYCFVSKTEEKLLLSPAKPIVLLKKKKDFSANICKNSDDIGAFLPCNPVQILILDKISPLVMTSANISGEPIITDNDKIEKLSHLGFEILSHDREIKTPLDDSIVREICGKVQLIRRSRGFVPLPIELNVKTTDDILAKGGDLKASFCLMKNNFAYMSQYFGDLEEIDCQKEYNRSIERMKNLHSINPKIICCDKHHAYFSYEKNAKFKWQHHHSHIASVIAEHKLVGDVLGFAFDGTGLGDDGTIWGGEVFVCNKTDFKRVEHLKSIKMTGGNNISKDAKTVLNCYLKNDNFINSALDNNINTIYSSSMGRLFDAVSSLLNICHYNDYEGKCSILLEKTANQSSNPYYLTPTWNGMDILNEIKKANAPKEDLALGFHYMLANLIVETAKKYKIKQIALSGGVFANRILTEKATELLEKKGFSVYINEKVPTNDGGIALGQVYLSALKGE